MTEKRETIGSIVVGVDGSESALDATAWAAREAAAHDVELLVVHAFLWPLLGVVDDRDSRSLGSRRHAEVVLEDAADLARRSAPGLTVRKQLMDGWPSAVLRGASEQAGMLVVGGHLTGRMHAAVAGSTVIALASSVDVPIVAVGSADPAGLPESPPDLPVMVGVDGSETSLRAAEFAAREARQHQTRLVIAHVKAASWPEATAATFYEEMREDHPDLDLEYRAVEGHAADGLVDASRDVRLLVVGTRGLGGLKGLLMGSVSQGLLRDAECPVAIVPHTWRPTGIANERPSRDVASAAG